MSEFKTRINRCMYKHFVSKDEVVMEEICNDVSIENEINNAKSMYEQTVKCIEYELDLIEKSYVNIKKRKLMVIKSFLKIARYNLQYSYIYEILNDWIPRNRGTFNNSPQPIWRNIFPYKYKDLNGNDKEISYITEKIDLSKVIVISRPWDVNKWANVLIRKSEFKYDEINHDVIYYPSLEIAVVNNGLHSLTDGWLNRESVYVKAKCIDDEELMSSIVSDGINWFNKYDHSKISKCIDYRIAILVFLYQKKKEIENTI